MSLVHISSRDLQVPMAKRVFVGSIRRGAKLRRWGKDSDLPAHFLLNALNSVTSLLRQGRSEDAESVIVGLASLLRRMLAPHPPKVRLAEELEFIADYLGLVQQCLGRRLQNDVSVPPECRDLLVPAFILQPIVENAIKHGMARDSTAKRLLIQASLEGDVLAVSVQNEGPISGSGKIGIGVSHILSQLAGLYRGGASFQLNQLPAGGTVAKLEVPAERHA